LNTDPKKRFPLISTSIQAQNALKIRNKKMGPVPKPLEGRAYVQQRKWDPQAKRVERSYSQDKKVRILSYWVYALVPDENHCK
jgi:hypothetical protein